jgi:hypothetical protein
MQVLNEKLHKLSNAQLKKPEETITLFPRISDNTHIIFTEDETAQLNKGLKYKVQTENWFETLALEAEIGMNFLPVADQDHFAVAN